MWKERDRRIFENTFKPAQQVASLTKEDTVQRQRAMNFFFCAAKLAVGRVLYLFDPMTSAFGTLGAIIHKPHFPT
jgi:hypothetical protein